MAVTVEVDSEVENVLVLVLMERWTTVLPIEDVDVFVHGRGVALPDEAEQTVPS